MSTLLPLEKFMQTPMTAAEYEWNLFAVGELV